MPRKRASPVSHTSVLHLAGPQSPPASPGQDSVPAAYTLRLGHMRSPVDTTPSWDPATRRPRRPPVPAATPACSATGTAQRLPAEGRLKAGRDGGQPGSRERLPPQTVPPGLQGPCRGRVPCRTHISLFGGTERIPEPAGCLSPPLARSPPSVSPHGGSLPGLAASGRWVGVGLGPCFQPLHPPVGPMACRSRLCFAPDDDIIAIYHPDSPGVESEMRPRLGPSAGRVTGPRSPEEPKASPR